jgi:hypothetical protein
MLQLADLVAWHVLIAVQQGSWYAHHQWGLLQLVVPPPLVQLVAQQLA